MALIPLSIKKVMHSKVHHSNLKSVYQIYATYSYTASCKFNSFSVCCAGAPSWFNQTQLCYQWRPDGFWSGQCGAGEPRKLCAYVGENTQFYRDDTDSRAGGCRMQWGIVSPNAETWFRDVKMCYRWFADGSAGQCGGGAPRSMCADVGSFTQEYRDDTDSRGGGCRMSWMLSVPSSSPQWLTNARLCYDWYPDGDGGQCGGGAARKLCATANSWTAYYRDDTDNRGGGCRMSWGLYL